MERILKFKKGDFITQGSSTQGSFAVFGGDVYDDKEGLMYSLLCYYNCDHYTQNSEGHFVRETVFECDVDDEVCDYVIMESDLDSWRHCTLYEENAALRFLAEQKKIAYEIATKSFRRLKTNEKISFDPPKSTGQCGGNVLNPNVSPYYNRNSKPARKQITRTVKDDWEQKEPIETMSIEHMEILLSECESLKYAFNSYSGYYGACAGGRNYIYGYGEDDYYDC